MLLCMQTQPCRCVAAGWQLTPPARVAAKPHAHFSCVCTPVPVGGPAGRGMLSMLPGVRPGSVLPRTHASAGHPTCPAWPAQTTTSASPACNQRAGSGIMHLAMQWEAAPSRRPSPPRRHAHAAHTLLAASQLDIAFRQRGPDDEPLKQGPPEIAAALGLPPERAAALLAAAKRAVPLAADTDHPVEVLYEDDDLIAGQWAYLSACLFVRLSAALFPARWPGCLVWCQMASGVLFFQGWGHLCLAQAFGPCATQVCRRRCCGAGHAAPLCMP